MGFGFGIASPARTVVLTGAPPGLTDMAAGVNTAAGQSGFTLGIVLSSMLLTEFASRRVVNELAQLGAAPDALAAVGTLFQDIFSRALVGDLTRVPNELALQAAALFGERFTLAMVATFLLVAFALALSAFAVSGDMSRGLQATFLRSFDADDNPPAQAARREGCPRVFAQTHGFRAQKRARTKWFLEYNEDGERIKIFRKKHCQTPACNAQSWRAAYFHKRGGSRANLISQSARRSIG